MMDTLQNAFTSIWIQFATTSWFFRNTFFINDESDPSGANKPFHSLYDFVVRGGTALYRITAIICWIIAVASMVFAGLSLAASNNKNDRFMGKTSVTRVAIIMAFLGGITGFVNTMFAILG